MLSWSQSRVTRTYRQLPFTVTYACQTAPELELTAEGQKSQRAELLPTPRLSQRAQAPG